MGSFCLNYAKSVLFRPGCWCSSKTKRCEVALRLWDRCLGWGGAGLPSSLRPRVAPSTQSPTGPLTCTSAKRLERGHGSGFSAATPGPYLWRPTISSVVFTPCWPCFEAFPSPFPPSDRQTPIAAGSGRLPGPSLRWSHRERGRALGQPFGTVSTSLPPPLRSPLSCRAWGPHRPTMAKHHREWQGLVGSLLVEELSVFSAKTPFSCRCSPQTYKGSVCSQERGGLLWLFAVSAALSDTAPQFLLDFPAFPSSSLCFRWGKFSRVWCSWTWKRVLKSY